MWSNWENANWAEGRLMQPVPGMQQGQYIKLQGWEGMYL